MKYKSAIQISSPRQTFKSPLRRHRAAQPSRRPLRRRDRLRLLPLSLRLPLRLPPLRFRPPLRGTSAGPPAKRLDKELQDRLAQPVRTHLHQRNLPLLASPRRSGSRLPMTTLLTGMLQLRVTLLSPPRYLLRASQTLRPGLRQTRR